MFVMLELCLYGVFILRYVCIIALCGVLHTWLRGLKELGHKKASDTHIPYLFYCALVTFSSMHDR
jgi:hypothetical protein